MDNVIASRIQARMDELGMNPSQVALDAGLGRSAVRDILSGKAKNPQFMTLARIARVLDCTTGFLTGDKEDRFEADLPSEHANFDHGPRDISGYLATGVFIQYRRRIDLPFGDLDDADFVEPHGMLEERPFRNERRFHGRDLLLFEITDNSLAQIAIRKGDVLTVISASAGKPPILRNGQIVVSKLSAPGLNAYELSAREVKERQDGKVELIARSREHAFEPILLDAKPSDSRDAGHPVYSSPTGTLELIGHVVRISRDVPL